MITQVMSRKQFLLPRGGLLLSAAVVLSLWLGACSSGNEVAGGPGSETTNGIVACVNGRAAPYAAVALRKVDHMAESAEVENAIVVADAFADSAGRFNLNVPDDGEYRLTVLHEGSAFTKIVNAESYVSLDSVKLEATAVMKGEVDIPEGSGLVWVGVLGTDILVPSDANGVFVIPSIPAGDSLQLYFVSENYREVLNKKDVYFAPMEFAYESYKSPVEVPADTADSADVAVDTVKKIVVLQADGTVASFANVALRSADYITERFALRNDLVSADVVSDAEGKFVMEWPREGSFRLTVTSGSNSFSKVYKADELPSLDTLKLNRSSTVTSKVTLDEGEKFAWVGVYGLDVLVKTNSSGSYVLPALPADENLSLYFIHADGGEPFIEWKVRTSKETTSILNPSIMLYDFEEPDERWYKSVDTLGKGSSFYDAAGLKDSTRNVSEYLQMDDARGSKVFHGKYVTARDFYAWALVGMGMEKVRNFVAVDSVEFYAKGNGNVRLALENWVSYSKGAKAASDWIALDSTWTRIVVKPSKLCINSAEVWDCEDAWNSVKYGVKQLHFFLGGGNEIYIDDVKLYGALF